MLPTWNKYNIMMIISQLKNLKIFKMIPSNSWHLEYIPYVIPSPWLWTGPLNMLVFITWLGYIICKGKGRLWTVKVSLFTKVITRYLLLHVGEYPGWTWRNQFKTFHRGIGPFLKRETHSLALKKKVATLWKDPMAVIWGVFKEMRASSSKKAGSSGLPTEEGT